MKWDKLEIVYDESYVLDEYLATIANKKLLVYKSLIHTGGKAGESLWAHIMNLVMITEKIRPLFDLNEIEYRCQLLALTIHDLNKITRYGNRSDGRPTRYANAAREGNLHHELKALGVDLFFPEWEEYLWDIKYLADAHNEKGQMDSQSNEEYLERCLLDPDRLEGPLRSLMKMADVSDNSHSGEYTSRNEKHIRDKLIGHLNTALNACGHPRRYRFIGHRLSELRALLTNLIHNQVVEMLQETYGKDLCIDTLYHAEGVDYLFDKKTPLVWDVDQSRLVAERVARKIASMQAKQLAQFIKAKPHGISVDDAAIQSGATVEQIFTQIQTVVLRKLYRVEWLEQRNALVRNDLEKALADPSTDPAIKEPITAILAEAQVLSTQEDVLRRGEYFLAYRNFLREQRGDQLRAVKQNEWERALRLFQCPVDVVTISQFIDPYRRAYFVARYLPAWTIAQMEEMVLKNLAELDEQAMSVLAKRQEKKKTQEAKVASEETSEANVALFSFDPAALVDYLQRNLVLWDSDPKTKVEAPLVDFRASLRRYADPKRPDTQCCYCGSPLQAEEWMAMQVPPNIGVQSFSNRLAGGSSREPKRNVCEICRTQFMLEKLSYQSHSDKQGKEYLTFYMHLFPYSFFTQPLLDAWWQSIRKLQTTDQTSLLVNAQDYLLQWQQHPKYFTKWQEDYLDFQENVMVTPRNTEGVTIPAYAELVSNVPVFPLVVKESHHGHKFLSALEKAAVLTRWFDCRLLLSRLPTPVVNLAEEYRDKQPVALLIENVPQALCWLVPDNTLLRTDVTELCRKLGILHTIAQLLAADNDQLLHVVYDLVSAAALDPLAIYHETDRLIEKRVTQKKSKQPAQLAIQLSHQVAPLLKEL